MNRNQICICLVVVSSLDFAFNAACQDRARYLNRDGFATIKGDSGSKNAAESKDTPEAAEAFRKFESAGKFFDRADFKSAVDACTQAITLNPKLEAAYSLRGDALFALGETKLAFEDLNKAVRIGSSSRSFSSRGFVYHELNQLKEALSDFNAAIKMDKTNSFALAYRGDTFRKMKEFDKAIADLTQSIAVGPIDASQFELRALAYLENRQYALAIPDYKAAIALNPKSSSAHIGRAYAFVKQEKYGDAIRDYETANAIKSGNADVCLMLGYYYSSCSDDAVRDSNKGLHYAKIACELTKWKNSRALDVLGSAHANAGDYRSAIKWASAALDQTPNEDLSRLIEYKIGLYKQGKPYRE